MSRTVNGLGKRPAECDPTRPDTTIGVGDRVRSYDFPEFRDDCYIEGIVEAVGPPPAEVGAAHDCYHVRATKQVVEGVEVDVDPAFFYPPVNGIPTWLSGTTCGVVKLRG